MNEFYPMALAKSNLDFNPSEPGSGKSFYDGWIEEEETAGETHPAVRFQKTRVLNCTIPGHLGSTLKQAHFVPVKFTLKGHYGPVMHFKNHRYTSYIHIPII